MYKIGLVGAGNVAWHLGIALEKAGHQVINVYSRHWDRAQQLAQALLAAKPTNQLDFPNSEAEIFFIAVTDDALGEVVSTLFVPENSIIAHTSGTHALSLVQKKKTFPAVFYPLQTFTKNKPIDFQNIPICIESNHIESLDKIKTIAQSLSNYVYEINSEKRQLLHLAAIFTCNFSNFLFTIGKDILEKNGMPFELLQNLVNETVQKAFLLSPENAQTGPAKRGDNSIIQKHLSILNQYPSEWKTLYEQFSTQIYDYHKKVT
jgi:predicted short-subunit dehydrogenase-like oxidoreductase (DUF2520 family)